VWLDRHIDPAQARRKDDTMEDVSGRSSILSHAGEDLLSSGGGRWNGSGHAGESSLRTLQKACRAAAVGRLGTEPMVPAGDNGRQKDGTISVKAPPAVATDDQARGVSIQDAERRRRVACSDAVPANPREGWRRGCIEVGSAEASVSE